ncbi:MAG TPA: pectate lyase [Verrucomicrobiales bacterium]|nr:pectate lyase [Verrucomicrobiales bacterium]
MISKSLLLAAMAVSLVSSAAGAIRWGGDVLKQKPDWYGSAEARAAAAKVMGYQSEAGAWPKNTDLLVVPTEALLAEIRKDGRTDTLDNGATTLPIHFLARVVEATGDASCRASVLRGVDYLLAAQYPNGGFPQFFPLRPKGYYSHITYNDGAMINTLELLRDVAREKAPFGFVDAGRRSRAADAVARGIECILRTQIRQDGKLTAWCAQHDAKTLEPAWARAYEPPSLSGSESVGIVRFLMAIEQPSPEIMASIEGAVAWFRRVAISGQRLEERRNADGRKERILTPDPAAPPLWARFYELDTHRPLYMDRDSKPNYDFMKVSYERRSGYGYHSTAPASLIEKDYPAWRTKSGGLR